MRQETKSSNASGPVIMLGYESPIFVEKRPRKESVSRPHISLAILVGLAGIAMLFFGQHARVAPLLQLMAWADIGIAVLMAVPITGARVTTSVYPDRIQFVLTGAGFRLWKGRIGWGEIEQCDVFTHGHVIGGSAAKGEPTLLASRGRRGSIFSIGLAGTFLMFRGDGVRFLLKDGQRIHVGSDDANQLANLVRETSHAWKQAVGCKQSSIMSKD